MILRVAYRAPEAAAASSGLSVWSAARMLATSSWRASRLWLRGAAMVRAAREMMIAQRIFNFFLWDKRAQLNEIYVIK